MDFIEQLFGISPDGGNGLTELAYIAIFLFIMVLTIIVLFQRRDAIRTLAKRILG
jgi:hypothetical protein